MSYLALVPWFFFFLTYSYYIYRETEDENNLIRWMKENLWKMVRLDNLLLIVIFIYFVRYSNNTVNYMLFFMMNLYLFINILYDLPSKINFKFKATIPYILISLIPIIYYLIFKKFVVTCFIMFGCTFFAYIIVIGIRLGQYHIKKSLKVK